jgi:hypothetical protein
MDQDDDGAHLNLRPAEHPWGISASAINELYLAAEGALQPLQLERFLVLRSGPESAKDACYFYSRLDGAAVRMVSYHQADQSERMEQLDDVVLAVRGFQPAVG